MQVRTAGLTRRIIRRRGPVPAHKTQDRPPEAIHIPGRVQAAPGKAQVPIPGPVTQGAITQLRAVRTVAAAPTADRAVRAAAAVPTAGRAAVRAAVLTAARVAAAAHRALQAALPEAAAAARAALHPGGKYFASVTYREIALSRFSSLT